MNQFDLPTPNDTNTPEFQPDKPELTRVRWINRLSIGHRLTVGFSILVVLTLFVIGLSYMSSNRVIASINTTHEIYVPTTLVSASARANLLKMRSNIHSYLLLSELEYRTDYYRAREDFKQDLAHMKELAAQWSDQTQREQVKELAALFDMWTVLPDRMFQLHDDPEANQPALRILKQEGEKPLASMLEMIGGMVEEQTKQPPSAENQRLLIEMQHLLRAFAVMESYLRGYVSTGDTNFKKQFQHYQKIKEEALQQLVQEKHRLSPEQQVRLDTIVEMNQEIQKLIKRVLFEIGGQQTREDLFIFRISAIPLADQMMKILDNMTSEQQQLLKQDLKRGSEELRATQHRNLFGGLIAFVVATLLALILRYNIVTPIRHLTQVVERITAGDLNSRAPVVSRDEIGILARSFNTMTSHLRATHKQLEDHNYTLEQKVQERTAELSQAVQQAEKATAEAREARSVAEDANRAKSQFLANMSHELRTPLNAIIGYSEMLKEEAEDLDYQDFIPDLNKIHTAGNHLLSLINDVLDLSKIEAGKMALYVDNFHLADLINSVITTINPLIQKNQNVLEVQDKTTNSVMISDQMKLKQVLVNLLSNATKFTKHGKITLTIRQETTSLQQDGFSQTSSYQKGIFPRFQERQDDNMDQTKHVQISDEWFIFEVADNGIGIAPDHVKKLFQAFTQADDSTTRKYGGTGLGLAISYRFCQMMGGSISVQSVLGQGSTFIVRLPQRIRIQEEKEESYDS